MAMQIRREHFEQLWATKRNVRFSLFDEFDLNWLGTRFHRGRCETYCTMNASRQIYQRPTIKIVWTMI